MQKLLKNYFLGINSAINILMIGILIFMAIPLPVMPVQIIGIITLLFLITYLFCFACGRFINKDKNMFEIFFAICIYLLTVNMKISKTMLLGGIAPTVFGYENSIFNSQIKFVLFLFVYSVIVALYICTVLRSFFRPFSSVKIRNFLNKKELY